MKSIENIYMILRTSTAYHQKVCIDTDGRDWNRKGNPIAESSFYPTVQVKITASKTKYSSCSWYKHLYLLCEKITGFRFIHF